MTIKVLLKKNHGIRSKIQTELLILLVVNPLHHLREDEIARILNQVDEAKGKEVPKVQFSIGEVVKILDGPFLNLTGEIEEIDPAKGSLKVSVSIFGRFTPVELEFWQVEKADQE